jgi:hypothetical protein
MASLLRLTAMARLSRLPWAERREQQTAQAEILQETGQALVLESSPDNAGNPQYLLSE